MNLKTVSLEKHVVYFTENIGKSTSKNVGKSLSSKCSQKLLHHAKQSPIDAPKPRSLFFY